MKIIYIGQFRLPDLDAAAPRVLNNAKALRSLGHDVFFISWGGKYRESDLCDDGKFRIDNFEYIITDEIDPSGSLFNKIHSKRRRGERSLAILTTMMVKPNLIIMYNADARWTKKMIAFCSVYNIKLANDITEWYDNNELRLIDVIPYYFNMSRLQRLVKNKIVISSYFYQYYQESNNVLLPPLCDPSEAKWNETVDDERIQPFDGVTLIYAGNPAKKDCVHTVINAVNQLASEGEKIRFIIIGTTKKSYVQHYSPLLETEELHENIIFLGRISQNLIPAYYKKADFMVLLREPSRKNMAGFPTKFAESMTAGVPVIANATSDIGLYIVNGKNGFIVKGFSCEDVLSCLKERVLAMEKCCYEDMKCMTRESSNVFNYQFYKDSLANFVENLE